MNHKIHPKLWQRSYLVNEAMNRSIRESIDNLWSKKKNGGVIVDIGCGAKPYRSLFEGRCDQYVGTDPYPQDPEDIKCTADALALSDDFADGVVCFQVLEHVPDPRAILREASRVLKPGAHILLTVPFMFPYHPSPTDYYRYTHEGLRTLFADAGLVVERIEGQCSTVRTLFLLVSYHLGMFSSKLKRKKYLLFVGWLFDLLVIVFNLSGLACDRLIPYLNHPEKSNNMFSNLMVIAHKPNVTG